MMKNFVTLLILGTLVTSCNLNSDPTKDTKYNYKNSKHSIDTTEVDIKQKSVQWCKRNLNVNIDKSYNFKPGGQSSNILVARSLNPTITTTLEMVKSDRNPPGLKLVPIANTIGEYQFVWDASKVKTKNYYEVYSVELIHIIKSKDDLGLENCAFSQPEEIELLYLTESKEIPIKVEQKDISDEGIIDLKHNLNTNNTFTISLPKTSAVVINTLPKLTDSIDIQAYTEIIKNDYAGTITLKVDNKALAERFKDLGEQELALSLTAHADGSMYSEEFQIHFKYKSNKKTEHKEDTATAEGK